MAVAAPTSHSPCALAFVVTIPCRRHSGRMRTVPLSAAATTAISTHGRVRGLPPSPEELVAAIKRAWGADTTYARLDYLAAGRAGDSSRGQCGPSALVIHDWLGGALMMAEVRTEEDLGVHYWNVLPDGTELDAHTTLAERVSRSLTAGSTPGEAT